MFQIVTQYMKKYRRRITPSFPLLSHPSPTYHWRVFQLGVAEHIHREEDNGVDEAWHQHGGNVSRRAVIVREESNDGNNQQDLQRGN